MPPKITADMAPRVPSEVSVIIGKVEHLASRTTALQAKVQQAGRQEALALAGLGVALLESLTARARAEETIRSTIFARYLSASRSRVRPDRRSRLRRLAERVLNRFGAIGRGLIILRSGLWHTAIPGWKGQVASFLAMVSHARRGPDPATQPPVLIDQVWYLKTYPGVTRAGLSPLVHYLLAGGYQGACPHPLFDASDYGEKNAADLAATGLSPLVHFVRVGAARGLNPHPLFDLAWYVAQVPELIETGENPLAHFLRVGAGQGLSPHWLFKPAYYSSQLASRDRPANPLIHYLTEGSARGLRPHPLFDPAWYREQYPQSAGSEPLSHYLRHGEDERLSPGPWFDSERYLQNRRSGERFAADPLSDYLLGGAWTGAQAHNGLHVSRYYAAHPELAAQAITPLEHAAAQANPA